MKTMKQVKLEAVKAALAENDDNITKAAAALKITPKTVRAILRRG